MARILFTYVVPLVLPFVVWSLWRSFSAARGAPASRGGLAAMPWQWLAPAGLVLLAATLGTIALTGDGKPGESYRSPHTVDGKVVPGRFGPAGTRD